MSAAKPGWYPDPAPDAGPGDPDRADQPEFRWWDGTQWTDQVGAGRVRQASRARRAVSFGLSLALVAVLGVLVGLVVWHDPRGDDAATDDAAAAEQQPPDGWEWLPTGQLDPATRVVTIGAARLTLPGKPYEVYDKPMRVPRLINEFYQANAVVHSRYDGQRDWSAVVALAHLKTTAEQSADLDQAAAAALSELAARFFGGQPTKVSRLSTSDFAVNGRPGVLLTARVGYRMPELPSRFDDVTAILVRLDDGSVVAALSSVPDDADTELVDLARRSLESLEIG